MIYVICKDNNSLLTFNSDLKLVKKDNISIDVGSLKDLKLLSDGEALYLLGVRPGGELRLYVIREEESVKPTEAQRPVTAVSGSVREVELNVVDHKPRDAGRGVVRVPYRYIKALGVEPGDYVEIVGNRKVAYAQVWPAYADDE
ncbi:MAG: hypothetical protein GXO23_03155, partial [Crenarchaeota archaeon]|nr:hypothetical protein [Thermoproteota archaeon]